MPREPSAMGILFHPSKIARMGALSLCVGVGYSDILPLTLAARAYSNHYSTPPTPALDWSQMGGYLCRTITVIVIKSPEPGDAPLYGGSRNVRAPHPPSHRTPPNRLAGQRRAIGVPTTLSSSSSPHTRESTDAPLQSPSTNMLPSGILVAAGTTSCLRATSFGASHSAASAGEREPAEGPLRPSPAGPSAGAPSAGSPFTVTGSPFTVTGSPFTVTGSPSTVTGSPFTVTNPIASTVTSSPATAATRLTNISLSPIRPPAASTRCLSSGGGVNSTSCPRARPCRPIA
eukprot:scaffold19322_cov124-Isochrysis_galbana.AAC.2